MSNEMMCACGKSYSLLEPNPIFCSACGRHLVSQIETSKTVRELMAEADAESIRTKGHPLQ